jgi:hypothetical protein
VTEAEELYAELKKAHRSLGVALEHSRLPQSDRETALERFRTGDLSVLVSVKSLVEGIDVPAADVGISVAASSSVRQRIQSLGRVLRRVGGVGDKQAEMHLLYVRDSVDEIIYSKEDWSDLTGPSRNHYWRWPLDPQHSPEPQPGPPLKPRPTEEQEWQRFGGRAPSEPVAWLGALPEREYSVDARGTVTTASGALVANPQDVAQMVEAIRARPGGRFWITPIHRLVLVRGAGDDDAIHVAGQLKESFSLRRLDEGNPARNGRTEVGDLRPGSDYPGPLDKAHGSFYLRRKQGGVIERSVSGRVREFASADDAANSQLAENARRLLAAWRQVSEKGFPFYLNEQWDAWYLEAGKPRFLANVEGGFEWPPAEQEG